MKTLSYYRLLQIFYAFSILAAVTATTPASAWNQPTSVKTESAQQREVTIQGIVKDAHGNPLPNANVYLEKNSRRGTSTDEKGRYRLNIPDVDGTKIVFSFIGMVDKVIVYKGQTTIHVTLEEEADELESAVVYARANINEIDVRARTGVVSEVNVKRMISKPTINVTTALQGTVPGLIVTNQGVMGDKPKIRIRGNSSLRPGDAANEPLYVLDGKVISSDAFQVLNPNDISDIKILKDAAACALYGIKAANGVIEITSQRGTQGKPMYGYSSSVGVTTRGRRGISMMDSKEKLELERLMKDPTTPGYRFSEDYYRKYFADAPNLEQLIAEGRTILDSLEKINTDWFKELIRPNFYQQHNVNMKGGSEQTSYYASVNYSQQGGRIPGENTQRFSGRISLDQRIARETYIALEASGAYGTTDSPNGSYFSPTDLVYQLNPYEQIGQETELVSFPGRKYADLFNQFSRESGTTRGGVSASINCRAVEGLDLAAVVGLDQVLTESLSITPPTAYSEITSGVPANERGIITKDKNRTTNLSSNVRATYNKVWDKHDFTIGANYDFYSDIMDNVGIRGYGLSANMQSPSGINQSIEGNRKPYVSSRRLKTAQMGIGVLAGYTYANIYDVFATFKSDASSILPRDKRWNYAWAAGLGWSIKDYSFLKDVKAISELKIKASYGNIASLQGVSPSASVGTFQYSQSHYGDQQLLYLMEMYNADLKPEHTIDLDVSLSIGLWNRVTLRAGYYKRRTKDALLDIPIPSSNGFRSMKQNIGILDNNGFEADLYVKIIDNARWYMTARLNVAYNRNKVVDLYHTDKLYTDDDQLVPEFEEGLAYDMIYGPISLGINPITGLPVYLGADGEEILATQRLTREDMVALGHSTPPWSGSFFYSVSYGNFDLDMDFYFVLGGIKPYSYTYVRDEDNIRYNAISGQTQDMWFHPGDENKIYHTPFYSGLASDNLNRFAAVNSRSVGSSNYLRMNMLSLRYRLPQRWLDNTKGVIKFVSLAFQASNLFTITGYKESDPESGTLAGTQQPIFTLNLNMSF